MALRDLTELRNKHSNATALIVCPAPSIRSFDFSQLDPFSNLVTIGVNRTIFFKDMLYFFMGIDPMRLEENRFRHFRSPILKTTSICIFPQFKKVQYRQHRIFSQTIPQKETWLHNAANQREIYLWKIGSAHHFGIPKMLPKSVKKRMPKNIHLYRHTYFPTGVLFTGKTVTIGAIEFARFLGCTRIGLLGNDLQTDGSSIHGYYVDNRVSHYLNPSEEGRYPSDFNLAIRSFQGCAAEGLFHGIDIVDFSTSRLQVFPKRPREEIVS